MNTDNLVPNEALAAEIQATIAIVGATDTARSLGLHHRTLAAYVRRRAFPVEVIARATEIGLVRPRLNRGSTWEFIEAIEPPMDVDIGDLLERDDL